MTTPVTREFLTFPARQDISSLTQATMYAITFFAPKILNWMQPHRQKVQQSSGLMRFCAIVLPDNALLAILLLNCNGKIASIFNRIFKNVQKDWTKLLAMAAFIIVASYLIDLLRNFLVRSIDYLVSGNSNMQYYPGFLKNILSLLGPSDAYAKPGFLH